MKQKVFAVCRHILYIGLVGGALFAVFIFSVLGQIFDNSVRVLTGEVAWAIIYIALPFVIGGVCLFVKYLLKWSFKKATLCAVIGVLIYGVIAFGVFGAARYYFGIFTVEKWNEYPYQRHWMLDDMTDKYQFIGMTRDEVTDILGKPDWPWDEQETDNSAKAEIGGTPTNPDTTATVEITYTEPDGKKAMGYTIGGMFDDENTLAFELEDGKVTKAYTYNDEYRTLTEPLY